MIKTILHHPNKIIKICYIGYKIVKLSKYYTIYNYVCCFVFEKP